MHFCFFACVHINNLNKLNEIIINDMVSSLNLVHTGHLQFLAIFHNLAGNEHGFLPKTSEKPKIHFHF